MAEPITRDVILQQVASAARSIGVPPSEADKVAKRVATAPVIAPALKPISRLKSQVIQGISAAGLAQIVQQTGLGESLVIVANWLGFAPDPVEFSQVFTTIVTLAGLALAWYGRETTTRPLA